MDILGRNQWGVLYPSPAEIGRIADEILEKLKNLEQTGGFLLIEHEVGQKPILMMLLLRLHGKLKRQDKKAELLLEKMAVVENFIMDSPYLIVPFPGSIPLLFEAQQLEGRVIIMPYTKHEWERMHDRMPDFPYEMICLKPVPKEISNSLEGKYMETVQNLLEEATPGILQAVYYTSLLDSLSIPMTYTLLARVMGMDEDQLQEEVMSQAEGLLFLAESEILPHLFITTAGEGIAHYFLSKYSQTERVKGYLWIVACANKQDITERHLIFNAVAGLMQRGMRGMAVNILGQCDVMAICQKSSATEITAWGGLLQGARLLDVSAKLFQQALARLPNNEIVLSGYLGLLVDWVLVDRKKYDETVGLFRRALSANPKNPYLIQLRVSLEVGLGNFQQAQEWIDKLYQEKLPAILKTGAMIWKITTEFQKDIPISPDKIKIWEKESNTVSTTGEKIMMYNALGTLYMENGEYQKGKRFFAKTLAVLPDNFSAQLGLATMDGQRGHWQEAKKITDGIFKVDPDHRQNLLFQSKMFLEQIKLGQGQDANKVLDYYHQAQERLRHLREIDPWNLEGDVTNIVLSVSMKDYDQAKEDLLTKVASRISPGSRKQIQVYIEVMAGNFAKIHDLKELGNMLLDAELSNALVRSAYQSGDKEIAQQYFSLAKRKLRGSRLVSTLNTWAELTACDAPHEALTAIRQSLQLDGRNAYTLLTAGKSILECGREWMVETLLDGIKELHGLKIPRLSLPAPHSGIIGSVLGGGAFAASAIVGALNKKKKDCLCSKEVQDENRIENGKILMDKARDMGLWL